MTIEKTAKEITERVLILVIVEYKYWQRIFEHDVEFKSVLILVIVEYKYWHKMKTKLVANRIVLILVIVEYKYWPVTAEKHYDVER